MSVHTGFLLAACVSALVTLPALVYAQHRRLPSRTLATWLYVTGYAAIAAALVLDPVLQPPLFVHGFVPGGGTGLILVGLALVLHDTVVTRRHMAGARDSASSPVQRSHGTRRTRRAT